MAELLHEDVNVYSLSVRGRDLAAWVRLAVLFRKEGVDIAHVNNIAPWLDVLLASRLARCRCVQTFHGIEESTIRFSGARRMMLRKAAEWSSAVTAVSRATKDLLVELTGVDESHVQVIENGVDGTLFYPPKDPSEREGIRRELGLPLREFLFVCVAALRPVKNHRGLIHAFAKAFPPTSRSGAGLVLVGAGSEESALRQQVEELELNKRIHFLGRRNDVAGVLKGMDAFVLNSRTEGLSYAVLEAMAAGLPVLATAVGANVKLVQDGREGFLYSPGDERALCGLLSKICALDKTTLQRMGMAARKRVLEDYGMDKMAREYQALYSSLLRRDRSPHARA